MDTMMMVWAPEPNPAGNTGRRDGSSIANDSSPGINKNGSLAMSPHGLDAADHFSNASNGMTPWTGGFAATVKDGEGLEEPPASKRARMSTSFRPSKEKRIHHCSMCDHSFARAEHRIRHERSHRNERPFSCQHCDSHFTRKDLQKRHMLRHHPEIKNTHGPPRKVSASNDLLDSHSSASSAQTAPFTLSPPSNSTYVSELAPLPVISRHSSLPEIPHDYGHSSLDLVSKTQSEVDQRSQVDLFSSQNDLSLPFEDGHPRPEMKYPFSPFDLDTFMNDMSFQLGRPSTPQSLTLPPSGMDGFLGTTLGNMTLSQSGDSDPLPIDDSFSMPHALGSSSLISRDGMAKPAMSDPLLLAPTSASMVQSRHYPWKGSHEISEGQRMDLVNEIARLFSVVGVEIDFKLPSCITLERYLTTFLDSFIIHVPCIHIPTWRADTAHPSLLLGMAAIGANYQYEKEIAYHLHRAARLSILNYMESSGYMAKNKPVWLMQSLFFTLAFGGWSGRFDLVQEALSLQSVFSQVWRNVPNPENDQAATSWEERWVHIETWKRAKLISFAFLNNLTMTFNTPPVLVNSEIDFDLPSSEREWTAPTPEALAQNRKTLRTPTPSFKKLLQNLLSPNNKDEIVCSCFGLYVMIHALLQHMWHLRQTPLSSGSAELTSLEPTLRKWQIAWAANAESSLSPHNPHGPLAFNSSALLRLAYVRLCLDLARVKSAVTSSSVEDIVLSMMHESGDVKRSTNSTRAALYAVHALRIPVKIGMNQVARTGMLVWSLQHHLYSFDCSLYLSKWLAKIHTSPESTWTDDERRVEGVVRETLAEVDLGISYSEKPWNVQLMYAWAKMFDCLEIWGITAVLGSSCLLYANSIAPESG